MDVAAWLRGLGLERYEGAFQDNEIDAELLPTLTAEDLKDLGVEVVGHRRKLLNAIADLESPQPRRGGAPDGVDPDSGEDRAADPAPIDGERRQVAILFADLAGYTQLSRDLDAEEVHDLLGRFFVLVDGKVKAHGGTIDKHIGDCVMAVFGAPVARGNDPERAVRAALAIQEELPALNAELARPVGVHMGIAAGEVVASSTGSDDHHEYTVTGEAVNLASRLTGAAKAGEILISDSIRSALFDWLQCDKVGPLLVKGVEAPHRAWRLRRWDDSADHRRPVFVGRRAELSQIEAALSACRETGFGQAIYVRGEAGIGKTRLVEEFQRLGISAGFVCHTSHVLDFGTATGRDAIRLLVRSVLGLGPDCRRDEERSVTERAITDGLIEPEQRMFLADLLDLPLPAEMQAFYDAMDNARRNHGKLATVITLVTRVGKGRPLLLVVEDVHWADALILQQLAGLAKAVANCRSLLVMTSRLEGDPIEQGWRADVGGTPLITIDLAPLRQIEAEGLARAYAEPSPEVTRLCIERAAGNPLFLEQLLLHAEDTTPAGIPASVQTLIQARLDRLEPRDKAALQAASIFGQRFSLDGLRFLTTAPHYRCDDLVARFLVRPGPGGFLFAHALIRDAIYGSLMKARRRQLHRRAAAWFAERDPVLHAEHLDRAEDPAAATAYLGAAQHQVSNYRYTRALALVERGLELTGAGSETFELLCMRGNLLRDLGSIEASIASFESARTQAKDVAQQCQATVGLASSLRVVGRFEDALVVLDQAETVARDQRLARDLAHVHYLRGNVYFPLGRLDGCLEQHELAQRLAREADAPDLEAQSLGGLADANYMRGRMLTALEHYRRCVDLARERELGAVEVVNWPMVGCARRYANELREAWDDSLGAIDLAIRAGNQRAEIVARQNAWLLRDMARLAEAKPYFECALALARSVGAHLFEPINLAELAFIAAAEGDSDAAHSLVEEAWSISRQNRPTFCGPWVLGIRSRLAASADIRENSWREAEQLLQQDCVGHNYYFFYSDAIEAALLIQDWSRADYFASALEAYTRPEPNPWGDLHIARGRALAAYGRGSRDEWLMVEIQRLADQARSAGLQLALPALDRALDFRHSAV